MIPRMVKELAKRAVGLTQQNQILQELEPISEEALAFLKTRYPRRKFFCLGYARSGTTLLARLIDLHPEILCRWQGHFFTEYRGFYDTFSGEKLSDWITQSSNRWASENKSRATIMRAAVDYILEEHAEQEGALVVGDKSPNKSGGAVIQRIHKVYPDANILYIFRDGRDVLYSKRIQMFIDGEAHLSVSDRKILKKMRQNVQPFLAGEQSMFTEERLKELASDWVQSVSTSLQRGRTLFGDAFKVIRYEDLVKDPVHEVRAVMEWLGALLNGQNVESLIEAEMAKNPAADWHLETAPELVRGLRRGVPGAWKDVFTEADMAVFMEAAGDLMLDLGYEM